MVSIRVWHPPGLKEVIEEAYHSLDAWTRFLEDIIQDISARGKLYHRTRSTFIDKKWRTVQTEELDKSKLKLSEGVRHKYMDMTIMKVDADTHLNLTLMCRIKQLVVRLEEQRKGLFTFEYMLYLQMHEAMHEKALEMLRRKAEEERKRD